MAPRTFLDRHTELLQSGLVALAYLLAFQVVFVWIPFTTETIWLWAFGLAEAASAGRLSGFFLNPEWWLALSFPIALVLMGGLAAYAHIVDGNPIPALIAGGYLVAFVGSELLLGMELVLLFILLAPVGAVVAGIAHIGWRRFRPNPAEPI